MYSEQKRLYVQQGDLLQQVQEKRVEAERLRADAVAQKQTALGNLYRSLVGEARALRLARMPGYRKGVWSRLRQALTLEVPDRDIETLRQEAVASMGDFVGNPTTWRVPEGILCATIHPSRRLMALSSADAIVSLRALPDGLEVERLSLSAGVATHIAFASDGVRLFTVSSPAAQKTTVQVWEMMEDDRWSAATPRRWTVRPWAWR